jgi:hypothetical protein
MTTPHGIARPRIPDQFGRFAIVLLALAAIAGLLSTHLVAQLVFWLLFSGGVALVLFSIVARPLGSPQRETWLAALLACGLFTLVLAAMGWLSLH